MHVTVSTPSAAGDALSRGPGIMDHPQAGNPAARAASLAVDLGADIVKLPIGGSVATMKRVVDSCPIPVLGRRWCPGIEPPVRALRRRRHDQRRARTCGRSQHLHGADPAAKCARVRRLLSFPIDDSHHQDTPPLAALATATMGISDDRSWTAGARAMTTAWIDIRGRKERRDT